MSGINNRLRKAHVIGLGGISRIYCALYHLVHRLDGRNIRRLYLCEAETEGEMSSVQSQSSAYRAIRSLAWPSLKAMLPMLGTCSDFKAPRNENIHDYRLHADTDECTRCGLLRISVGRRLFARIKQVIQSVAQAALHFSPFGFQHRFQVWIA
jgi:hypothetical protein